MRAFTCIKPILSISIWRHYIFFKRYVSIHFVRYDNLSCTLYPTVHSMNNNNIIITLAQLINGNVMSGHNRETGKEQNLTWRVTTRSSPNFSCTWIHLSICHPDRLLAPRFRTLPHLTRSFRVRNVSSRGTATSQMWVCENLHKKFDTFLIAHMVPF